MKDLIENSIKNSNKLKSKINQDVLDIDGLSSPKVRHLLNNLCNNKNYLEIGTWKGSTIVSASFKNKGNFYAIDCFTKLKLNNGVNPKKELLNNKDKFSKDAPFIFFESNSWNFDLSNIDHKIDIYFYDGDHSYEGTQKGFTYYEPILSNECVIIVDDWNRTHVKQAINDLKFSFKLMQKWELITPHEKVDKNDWWNSLFIGYYKKLP